MNKIFEGLFAFTGIITLVMLCIGLAMESATFAFITIMLTLIGYCLIDVMLEEKVFNRKDEA